MPLTCPAPPIPVFFAGAQVLRMLPYAPKAGAAVNCALMSYNGVAQVGVNIDTMSVPNPPELVADLRAGLEEIAALARSADAPADSGTGDSKVPAKEAPAAKKAPAKKTAVKRTTAKKTPASKKAAAKKSPAKKTATPKATAKKSPAKKTATPRRLRRSLRPRRPPPPRRLKSPEDRRTQGDCEEDRRQGDCEEAARAKKSAPSPS